MSSIKSFLLAAFALGGRYLVDKIYEYLKTDSPIDENPPIPLSDLTTLDQYIVRISGNYLGLTNSLLQSFIRFPLDNIDSGLINLPLQFLIFLKAKIKEVGAVINERDLITDSMGNIVWPIYDDNDTTPFESRTIIFFNASFGNFFDSYADWSQQFGSGIDAFSGLNDPSKVNYYSFSSWMSSTKLVDRINIWCRFFLWASRCCFCYYVNENSFRITSS